MKLIYSIVALVALCFGGTLNAQTVSIATSPRVHTETTPSIVYTVTPVVSGAFSSSIYLRASSPTLPGVICTFTPLVLNPPYQKTSTMTVVVNGAKPGGDHQIIIEGYNGPLVVRDTVLLTITDRPAWKVYTTANSPLPSDTIHCLEIDPNGAAWIGTDDGLARLEDDVWTIYEYPGSWKNKVSAICIDSAGKVWYADRHGLHSIEYGVKGAQPVTEPNYKSATSLAAGRNGELWVVWDQSVHKNHNGVWTEFNATNSMLSANSKRAVVDDENSLWVLSHNHGVDRFDGAYWTHFDKETMDIDWTGVYVNMFRTRDDHIWVVAEMGTVIEFDGVNYTKYIATYNGPRDSAFPGTGVLTSLVYDASGTKWKSSIYGLHRYDGYNRWHYNVGNSGLPNDMVNDLKTGDNNAIWIGTQGGLAVLDGNMAPLKAFTTSVEEVSEPLSSLIQRFAPVPTSSVLNVELSVSKASYVKAIVYDVFGGLMTVAHDGIVQSGRHPIMLDVSAYPPGMYVMQVVSDSHVESRPFVVNR